MLTVVFVLIAGVFAGNIAYVVSTREHLVASVTFGEGYVDYVYLLRSAFVRTLLISAPILVLMKF